MGGHHCRLPLPWALRLSSQNAIIGIPFEVLQEEANSPSSSSLCAKGPKSPANGEVHASSFKFSRSYHSLSKRDCFLFGFLLLI